MNKLLLLLCFVLPLNSYAEVKCKDVIKACDSALLKKEVEIKATNDALGKSKDYNILLDQQLKNTQDQLDAWYRNPFILLGFGVLGGAAAAAVFIKK